MVSYYNLQEVVKEDTNFQKINFDITTKSVPESRLFFFPTHLVSEATMQRLFSPVPKSPPAHATFIVVTPGNNEDEDGGTRRHTRIYIWCPIKVLLSNHNSTPLLQVLNGARRSNTSDLLHCTRDKVSFRVWSSSSFWDFNNGMPEQVSKMVRKRYKLRLLGVYVTFTFNTEV